MKTRTRVCWGAGDGPERYTEKANQKYEDIIKKCTPILQEIAHEHRYFVESIEVIPNRWHYRNGLKNDTEMRANLDVQLVRDATGDRNVDRICVRGRVLSTMIKGIEYQANNFMSVRSKNKAMRLNEVKLRMGTFGESAKQALEFMHEKWRFYQDPTEEEEWYSQFEYYDKHFTTITEPVLDNLLSDNDGCVIGNLKLAHSPGNVVTYKDVSLRFLTRLKRSRYERVQ